MLFRRLVLGLVAAGLLAGSAAAADLPLKARPIPVESWNWTGFYGGLHAGVAWDVFKDGDAITCPTTTCTPAASAINDINRLFGATSLRKSGFEGGGQLGFNYQMGSVVAGVEVDYSWLSLSISKTSAGNFYTAFPLENQTITTTAQAKGMFTARGRIGFLANPATLLYVTAGVAATKIDMTHAFAGFGGNGVPGGLSAAEASAVSKTAWGLVLGGGAEYKIDRNWSIKAEYLWAHFDNINYAGRLQAVDAGGAPLGNPYLYSHTASLNLQTVSIGLNYKFDWGGPIVARY